MKTHFHIFSQIIKKDILDEAHSISVNMTYIVFQETLRTF